MRPNSATLPKWTTSEAIYLSHHSAFDAIQRFACNVRISSLFADCVLFTGNTFLVITRDDEQECCIIGTQIRKNKSPKKSRRVDRKKIQSHTTHEIDVGE